jgi:hypothetical protein
MGKASWKGHLSVSFIEAKELPFLRIKVDERTSFFLRFFSSLFRDFELSIF